jgi:hypothetical protein
MKFALSTVASTVLAALAILLSPAAAFACKPLNSEHCYGEAYWDVEGQSGGFKGLYDLVGINSEALYAWNQEGSKNFISNEAWVEWEAGIFWNESGEMLGCVVFGCTPEHADRWFWFARTPSSEGGAMSPEGGGAEEWQVYDYYDPSNKDWYVSSKNWAAFVSGQESYAPIIKAGVEVTTSSALNSGGATTLEWEDLQGKWHSGWSSGSGNAALSCVAPAKVAWIKKYITLGYGIGIEWPCDNEDAMVSPPNAEASSSGGYSPALKPMPASSPLATMPNLSTTSTVSTSELKTRVTAIAANLGEPDPTIEVAKAPRAEAMAAVTPGISFDETGNQKEWLNGSTYAVVLHGHFESAEAPSRKQTQGEKPYTTLSVVIDAKTGEVSSFNLTEPDRKQPAISQLRDVNTL